MPGSRAAIIIGAMLIAAILGWLLLAMWLVLLVPLWPLLATRWLRCQAAGIELPEWPLVSVVVPARNEGAKVEAGLRSLSASDYPNLEVIAVDDRSTDETGRSMDAVAAADPRIRVVHVTELPAGWLGKNHALQMAGQASRGEWILFTDGDVQFRPDAIRLAVAYAATGGRNRNRPLDFLCLAPEGIPGNYLENALCAFFGFLLCASVQPFLIRTRAPFAYCGIGAFNLVRRKAWEQIGGHTRIRLDVMDDVHLGKLLKHSGLRCDMLLSGDLVRVRWQDSLWGVVRGLEKNAFASFEYSLPKTSFATLLLTVMVFSPYVGAAFVRGPAQIPWIAALLLLHGTFAWYGHQSKAGWAVVFALPVACGLFVLACWRSAIITLRQGGVRWRDTFYPLAELRAQRLRL